MARSRRKKRRVPGRPPNPPPESQPQRPSRRTATVAILAGLALAALAALGAAYILSRSPKQLAHSLADPAASPSPEATEAEPPDRPPGSSLPRPPLPAGHRRMLSELDAIRRKTPEENPWQGDRAARAARDQLAALGPEASHEERWQHHVSLAQQELRLGNERPAIEQFRNAYELLPALQGRLPQEQVDWTTFRLGLAYMRLGETQNCALRHTAESCILPIRGAGIHTDPEGSRQAIHYFLEVLNRTAPGSPLHLSTLWLFNIAYMTLGEYPDQVPAPHLIPPTVFESDQAFPRFENVAPREGIATFNLFGSALAEDLDNDGDLDILTSTFDTAGQTRLFRNRGDMSFTEATLEAGLSGLYGGLNMVQADYDNDGNTDVLILRGAWLSLAGRHPNSLLRNNGIGADGQVTFTDVTFEAGLGEVHYPTQTAGWADYDNDGDLDLYIGNEHGDHLFDGPCQLFRNDGAGADGTVTFTDVAREAGVENRRFVKGVVWGDFNGDRWPDLYTSTVEGPNRLYRNNGADEDGQVTFTDVAPELGLTGPIDSFPVWFWDYDNDGNLDLYVPSYLSSSGAVGAVAASYLGLEVPVEMPRLYRGNGKGGFLDVAPQTNLTRLHLPMGANFGDLDNDGFLDFYLGTGYPDYEALMPNVMYRNVGGRRFADVTLNGGFGHLQKGHAVAFADFDHDGDLDLFTQMGGAFPGDKFSDALYENPGFGHHWLALELSGRRSNRSAIGARLKIEVIERGRRRTIYRHVTSGGSFGSNPLRQTLGLGQAERIERLEVYWPTTDRTQSFKGVAMDQLLRLEEGADQLVAVQAPGRRASPAPH